MVVDEIRGLKQLLDEGILTEEKFTAKKKQLLGI
nr:MAG TPA: Short C-terminal domain [Caudoviricetes sp.]